jgi:DNA (cytosine-5)-methyltransferase 1
MKTIKVGSDFSGVGAFDQALRRLGINYETIFACDIDKYARDTFIYNYGEPKYYPLNVYEREIPSESLDIYMTSPPCQSFSSAGQKKGKQDKRGILFFNSHEFIQVNKPRFFIFENVKGLLSDNGGRTFQEWVYMLGGKSVNGLPVIFPHDDSVDYHLYWKVLNAKNHGIPQNRERVFLIGIRDNCDNKFQFPMEEHLTKRLKDILEENVSEKYFLSEKMIEGFNIHNKNHNDKGTGFIFKPKTEEDIASCLRANAALCPTDNTIQVKPNFTIKKVNNTVVKNSFPIGEIMYVDTYNETIHKYAKTITSRVDASNHSHLWNGYKIRKLTPRECFRLMDFPDSFTWKVSNAQAFKQAGNSIVVRVLVKIINNLNL